MESSFSRARRAALAVGAGVLASLALAGPSFADEPVGGVACQTDSNLTGTTDGQISGRGATFATKAQQALIAGYTTDVCGKKMLSYNDATAEGLGPAGLPTGSGAGQNAASWRSDFYGGSDIPYDQTTWSTIGTGACGALTATKPADTGLMPAQSNPCTDPDSFAGQGIGATGFMSFPYVGSSVAMAVNLQAARDCGGHALGTLRFTGLQMSRIMGGDIQNWNDAFLRSNGQNSALQFCNVAITRVVRQDKSGTTQIYKNYFSHANGDRTGSPAATCQAPGSGSPRVWAGDLNLDGNNRDWPGSDAPTDNNADAPDQPAQNGCSAIKRSHVGGSPAGSGAGALLTVLNATPGGVGYADLPDVATSALVKPQVANPAGVYQSPNNGTNANCDFSTSLTLPGGGDPNSSVGLDGADNYAYNQAGNHVDATFQGTGYPICGVTFMLVWTGLSDTSGTADNNPISRMKPNERRTLYSYVTYVLSSAGQRRLQNINYAPIPASWLDSLLPGFQANF